MASISATAPDLGDEHLDAAENVLVDIIDQAEDHNDDPQAHLHMPGNQPQAHSWLRTVFPYASLADFESQWHLGNYVMDRKTCQRSFEPMSIYVRIGMHLLYYGTQQENVLQWKRTQQLLKDQSVKMGKQYDSPESKAHIQPFIQSFKLEGTLHEFVSSNALKCATAEHPFSRAQVEPNPQKYTTFNDFFARQIKESARPIAEPSNDKVVSSLADCRLTTYPTIDLATRYWIKGYGFTVPKLLGLFELAESFRDGSILIHRLAPQDYHRWHAPTSGKVVSITDIPGT